MNSGKDYYQLYLKYKRKYLAEQKRQEGGGVVWYKFYYQNKNKWIIYETKPGTNICTESIQNITIVNMYISTIDISSLTTKIINSSFKLLSEDNKKELPPYISSCVPLQATVINYKPGEVSYEENPPPDPLQSEYGKLIPLQYYKYDSSTLKRSIILGVRDSNDMKCPISKHSLVVSDIYELPSYTSSEKDTHINVL